MEHLFALPLCSVCFALGWAMRGMMTRAIEACPEVKQEDAPPQHPSPPPEFRYNPATRRMERI